MNPRTLTSSIVVAALCMAAVPAAAQERRPSRRDGERARATEPAARQDRAQRARPRAEAQRQSDSRPRAVPERRRDDNRSLRDRPRAVPRSERPVYRGDDRPRYVPPRSGPRFSRPYFYSRPYVRPRYYSPYRPFRFSRPYYAFRPRLSIGFGLWIGHPVPYPYTYLGNYRPRVYGYYGPDAYSANPGVPIYGGLSFDIQPYDADLFVDGDYVGTVGDFTPGTEPLTLTPGVHRIAIQHDGFRPMEWEVTIEPGQVIPYRGNMQGY